MELTLDLYVLIWRLKLLSIIALFWENDELKHTFTAFCTSGYTKLISVYYKYYQFWVLGVGFWVW